MLPIMENMNVLERFYVYKTVKYKPTMNEQLVMDPNILFDIVIDRDTDRSISRNVGATDCQ
jgi:hypothetical protein